MGYVPLEKIIDKAEFSMYKLVILAARRALEVSEGSPAMVKPEPEQKATTTSLQELAAGKVFLGPSKEKGK